jgi:serine/threonine-protein kinase
VVGKNENQARSLIGDAGLAVGSIDRENSDSVPAGKVISQDPGPDQYVNPETAVNLVISLGKPEVQVPFVVDMTKEEAKATLEEAGLEVRLQEEDSDEDQGTVIRTDPSQGQSVAAGTTVTVYFSDGPEEIPDVVGLKQPEAKNKIRNAGFQVEVIENPNTTEPAGTVLSQSPQGGQTADQGTTVTIVVSSYEPSESPSPTETPSETPTESPSVQVPRVSPPTPTAGERRS